MVYTGTSSLHFDQDIGSMRAGANCAYMEYDIELYTDAFDSMENYLFPETLIVIQYLLFREESFPELDWNG